MRNVKIIFSYDGTNFKGYQTQPNERTVQESLEKVISSILLSDTKLVAAGRTDAGVHAFNQVGNFYLDSPITLTDLKRNINKRLPKDILVKEIYEETMNFNARSSAKSRSYLYMIKPFSDYTVFDRNYFHFVKAAICPEKLSNIMAPLIGEHNFTSFTIKNGEKDSYVRNISEIRVFNDNGICKISITANSFLRGMVRTIIGSALAVYYEKRSGDYLKTKLQIPDLHSDRIIAPPQGLYFYQADY